MKKLKKSYSCKLAQTIDYEGKTRNCELVMAVNNSWKFKTEGQDLYFITEIVPNARINVSDSYTSLDDAIKEAEKYVYHMKLINGKCENTGENNG